MRQSIAKSGETRMTKKELLRRTALENALCALGFTSEEAAALQRISNTLQRWYLHEAGTDYGAIERDDETDKPRFYWEHKGKRYSRPIPDREAGAKKRLARIIDTCNKARTSSGHEALNYYIQSDPRGACLYILRPGDIPAGYRADSCYTNGICVY
jgi:hypothetical protein